MLCHSAKLAIIERKMHKITEEINNWIVFWGMGMRRFGNESVWSSTAVVVEAGFSYQRVASYSDSGNKLLLYSITLSFSLSCSQLACSQINLWQVCWWCNPLWLGCHKFTDFARQSHSEMFWGRSPSAVGSCDLVSIKWNANVNIQNRF